MHPIIQAGVDEFEKEFGDVKLGAGDSQDAFNKVMLKAFLSSALQRAIKKAGKKFTEVKGCRYGCFCATCSLCDENTFIHCSDCVAGLPISLKSAALSKLDTIINFKE